MLNQTKSNSTSTLDSTSQPKAITQDSDHIVRPEKIIDDFVQMNEPFVCFKFMFDHLLELLSTGFFSGFNNEELRKFNNRFYSIAETIFQLEKHAEDHSLQWHIRAFAKYVGQKSQQEIDELDHMVKSIVKEYGSLKNGLHHLANAK